MLCRRVLLSLHNGSSAEVAIPGGEGLRDDDFAGLSAALKRLGYGGIARIQVLGLGG